MIPYVVLVAIPFVYQHFDIRRQTLNISANQHKNEVAMGMFWFLLFLLLVLRHESIGIDLPNYQYVFLFASKNNWQKTLARSPEKAWSFVNKVVSLFTTDFRVMMIVAAILGTMFIVKAYVKYSQDATLSIVLYMNLSCFILLFSGLRQSVAISLGFLAFEFVRKKKIFLYITVVIIAILFHTSAFMLLLMYPLYHIRLKKSALLFIVPIFLVLFVYNQQIFTFLGDILQSFTDYDTTISNTGAYSVLILFALLAITAFIIPDELNLDADTLGMRNFLLLAVVLQMFAPLHNLAMRMNYYYIAFIPILMTRIIKSRSKAWMEMAMVIRYVMVIFFTVYFFMFATKDNVLQTFPYKFYWEDIHTLK